jgi:hypothetical protein
VFESLRLLSSDSFVEMEVRGSTDIPGYPTLYYLGRESFFKEFLFLLPTGNRQPTSLVQLSVDRLGTFLFKRLQARRRSEHPRRICVIDTLLQGSADPSSSLFTPSLRATLCLKSALPAWTPILDGGRINVDRSRADAPVHLGVRLSESFDDFDLFYEHMYRPVSKQQSLAKDSMWRIFSKQCAQQQGHLLLMGEGDNLVCGAIVFASRTRPNTLVVYRGGILRPDMLSSEALAQHTLQFERGAAAYARRAGFTTLDLGMTPARLDDPKTALRLSQGCQLQADADAPRFSVHLPTAARERVLQHAPLLVERGGSWGPYLPLRGALSQDAASSSYSRKRGSAG